MVTSSVCLKISVTASHSHRAEDSVLDLDFKYFKKTLKVERRKDSYHDSVSTDIHLEYAGNSFSSSTPDLQKH